MAQAGDEELAKRLQQEEQDRDMAARIASQGAGGGSADMSRHAGQKQKRPGVRRGVMLVHAEAKLAVGEDPCDPDTF